MTRKGLSESRKGSISDPNVVYSIRRLDAAFNAMTMGMTLKL
jgi:hypothetical protein